MDNLSILHVLFLPFPAQGHVKPMLILAELFSHAGFQVTFINTVHIQGRLERSIDISGFHARFPKFLFMSIPDGLPLDHPRSGPSTIDVFFSVT